MTQLTDVYLVWNHGKSECVGFTDKRDAKFASTGDRRYSPLGYSTLALEFRELYEDEADEADFEIEKVTIQINETK